MIKRISIVLMLLTILFHSTVIRAEGFKYVEIFDPKQNKVVKVVQLTAEIHNMVANWIMNVDSIYAKNDPLTDDGYAIRIPLDPAVKLQVKHLSIIVNEVYIIIPENNPSFFIITTNENIVYCFPFNKNVDILSKVLDFKLKVDKGSVKE